MTFAGYPAQMEEFIKLNPGFRRRIRAMFICDDFTCEELDEIFMRKLQTRGFNTDITVQELGNLNALHTPEDFRKAWNAGFCDRLFELAKESLAERLCSDSFGEVKDDESELSQISKEDIQKAIGMISHSSVFQIRPGQPSKSFVVCPAVRTIFFPHYQMSVVVSFHWCP